MWMSDTESEVMFNLFQLEVVLIELNLKLTRPESEPVLEVIQLEVQVRLKLPRWQPDSS